MAETYSLGPYKGELLLDLGGLFRVIRFAPSLPDPGALEQALRQGGVPSLVYMGDRAGFIGLENGLWCPADREWEETLLGELAGKDPLSAKKAAEQAVQAQILCAGIRSTRALKDDLAGLERYLEGQLAQAQQRKEFGVVARAAQQLEALQQVWVALEGAQEALRAFAKQFGVEAPEKTAGRPAKGRGGTPQKAYRRPLLEALQELGGTGKTKEVLQRVLERTRERLFPEDFEYIVHGKKKEPVWMNRARWEIAALKEEGLVEPGGYGVLILTDKGRRYLQEQQ